MFTICLLAVTSMSLPAQFSATMIYTLSGMQRSFKVFGDENRYRYEFTEDGQEGVVIVLNQTGEFFLLMPQQKMAIRSGSITQMSMSTDPLKQYEYFINEGATEKVTGKEKVNGYDCIKKELRNIVRDEYGEVNQLLFTLWYSEELKFPVKMLSHIDGTGSSGMELKDIKTWAPKEDSFNIPEGYTVIDQ